MLWGMGAGAASRLLQEVKTLWALHLKAVRVGGLVPVARDVSAAQMPSNSGGKR